MSIENCARFQHYELDRLLAGLRTIEMVTFCVVHDLFLLAVLVVKLVDGIWDKTYAQNRSFVCGLPAADSKD
ncbi:MAG: hypothetical protein JGK17_30060 [Microcoleus sp. PH2017_10_PVI_O_A]|uniref:hypothetical protein n=1 Tax=unclassified Microcoleus TaxID=2642155 RepID=UPI001D781AE6|nr:MULTISPECIES: hypothetical protein [unclassified Microcoleus]MCC3409719.1 hypothetical protein [Microcoleus sp. PH2017_10_PVI_O_A]MCC3463985.1 hypothetical protein [Microcoleus sp. PH2017_11_PCY_U_A]MCC3482315.1 hypothetical protein [Microcoleus sp. PH2017_12_PCY_D_A]MCC3529941.1 hypothetical protein [Microcoleus sp. PH2017_21_RUC_O_A]MCC3542235.1 hypothetical protein [Microcoleus sp. PH2017_22_RUC_O_B]